MGLSGQNFFGADIGGFLGSPNAELFIRWLQFGSTTPFMRNHSMNTSNAREPWRFGEPYTSVARYQIEWRYRVMPYLTTLPRLRRSPNRCWRRRFSFPVRPADPCAVEIRRPGSACGACGERRRRVEATLSARRRYVDRLLHRQRICRWPIRRCRRAAGALADDGARGQHRSHGASSATRR